MKRAQRKCFNDRGPFIIRQQKPVCLSLAYMDEPSSAKNVTSITLLLATLVEARVVAVLSPIRQHQNPPHTAALYLRSPFTPKSLAHVPRNQTDTRGYQFCHSNYSSLLRETKHFC